MRFTSTIVVLALASASALTSSPAPAAVPEQRTVAIDANQWRVIPRESGKDNYYTVVNEAGAPPFIRARYHAPQETAVLGFQIPDEVKSRAQALRWQWRAQTLPTGGDECQKGKEDSAAVVYVTWRRGLKWYTVKYVWSAVGPKGATCDRHNTPFSKQETVVLQSGGPLDTWHTEVLDLPAEFRKHFADGKADAEVPDLIGLGIMTDGDQTKSESSADYAGFVVSY
jgi:hypothetical protein